MMSKSFLFTKNILNRLIFVFLIISIPVLAFSQETVSENMQKARDCFAQLEASGNYKEQLNQADMNILPAGINQTISNMNITLAVSSAEFFTDYTSLDVFVRLLIPNRKEPLMFGAKGVKLSHDGDIIGDTKISLFSNVDIPLSGGNVILRIKGNYDTQTGQSDDLSFVTIDCKGIKQLGLAAEVELSDQLCVPVDNAGRVIPNARVIGKIQTQIENWSDILAKVSFPSFAVKGLDGFVWNVEDAVFDFSDLKNDQSVTFPFEYRQYLIPGQEVLWKGVYVKRLSVTLPPQFSRNDEQRVRFFAAGMIIDDNGITGTFGAENILPIHEGNAGGWAFSVNKFNLKLLANHLEEARFSGLIQLPVSDKSRLAYDGLITTNDEYILRVASMDTLSFDLFQAQAELDPNSYIELKVVNERFRPEAMLHGRMGVYLQKENKPAEHVLAFKGIEFRSLHLQTQAPVMSVGYFGYKGEAGLMNFPISINEIGLTVRNEEAILGIGADITLMENTFKGTTRIEIVGKMDNGKFRTWRYDHFDINKIKVEATIGEIMTLKAGLTIMNADPIYGDGFGGDVTVVFAKNKGPLKNLSVAMRGRFGKKEDFRYWFVDGIANLPNGIPIAPAINLTGFGGGVTYRMKPAGTGSGQTLSATSMIYVPDKTYSLGLKAATTFNIGSDAVTKGEACFELTFNNHGGLNYAGFYGQAQFIAGASGINKTGQAVGEKFQKIIEKEKEMAGKLPGNAKEILEKTKQYNPDEAGQLYADIEKIK